MQHKEKVITGGIKLTINLGNFQELCKTR